VGYVPDIARLPTTSDGIGRPGPYGRARFLVKRDAGRLLAMARLRLAAEGKRLRRGFDRPWSPLAVRGCPLLARLLVLNGCLQVFYGCITAFDRRPDAVAAVHPALAWV